MNHQLKEYFSNKLGQTIAVNDAYNEFVSAYTHVDKTDFQIKSHYLGFVKRKSVKGNKYFVVNTSIPFEDCMFQ